MVAENVTEVSSLAGCLLAAQKLMCTTRSDPAAGNGYHAGDLEGIGQGQYLRVQEIVVEFGTAEGKRKVGKEVD